MHINDRTIKDFGEQWTKYTDNEGHHASMALLQDIFGPLFSLDDIRGKHIAEVGSGTGRIVNMLLDAGADHVTALEPSDAFTVLKENTKSRANSITYVHDTGDNLPAPLSHDPKAGYDLVVSIGVIHHIPDPENTMKAIYNALADDGKTVIWVYGYENNELYLKIFTPLRKITTRLPHIFLAGLAHVLAFFLNIYIAMCKHVNLPMHQYMNNVLAKFTKKVRYVTIYDQLNPAWAKYYKKYEFVELLQNAGFKNIQLYHRHQYSWTAIAEK